MVVKAKTRPGRSAALILLQNSLLSKSQLTFGACLLVDEIIETLNNRLDPLYNTRAAQKFAELATTVMACHDCQTYDFASVWQMGGAILRQEQAWNASQDTTFGISAFSLGWAVSSFAAWHEFAHVYIGHPFAGDSGQTEQEIEADAFAFSRCELMLDRISWEVLTHLPIAWLLLLLPHMAASAQRGDSMSDESTRLEFRAALFARRLEVWLKSRRGPGLERDQQIQILYERISAALWLLPTLLEYVRERQRSFFALLADLGVD